MQQAIALPLPRGTRVTAYHEPVDIGSDEALACRAARGDEAAFEQLVIRHQDKLYTLALRVTLSEADAYDCVQEGLIAAWRALPRFRGDARFSTWMYRIVVRKAYDAIDRRKRTPEPVEELHAVAPRRRPRRGSTSSPPLRASTRTSASWPSHATSSGCRWSRPARCWSCRRARSSHASPCARAARADP
jgi:RNA polymerase sigma-70 factor (ECF subfamily)